MSHFLLEKHSKLIKKNKLIIEKIKGHNDKLNNNIKGLENKSNKNFILYKQLNILYIKRKNNLKKINEIRKFTYGVEGMVRGLLFEIEIQHILNKYLVYFNTISIIDLLNNILYFNVYYGYTLKNIKNNVVEYDIILIPIYFEKIYKMNKTKLRSIYDIFLNNGIILEIKCKFRIKDCNDSQFKRHLIESKYIKIIYICNNICNNISKKEIKKLDIYFKYLRDAGHNIHIIHDKKNLIKSLLI